MTSKDSPRPRNVAPFPNGDLAISWDDGHESFYPGHALRCACTCAKCVDEMTGAVILRADSVPQDVRPLEIFPVGNYGISIRWSDDHDTGIYTFATLRRLCHCKSCEDTRGESA